MHIPNISAAFIASGINGALKYKMSLDRRGILLAILFITALPFFWPPLPNTSLMMTITIVSLSDTIVYIRLYYTRISYTPIFATLLFIFGFILLLSRLNDVESEIRESNSVSYFCCNYFVTSSDEYNWVGRRCSVAETDIFSLPFFVILCSV